VRIANLQRQIVELELDARQEESLAGNGTPNDALNTVAGARFRREADQYRAEAARLRAELAGLDVLTASSTAAQ
jgi:hypothetical protein